MIRIENFHRLVARALWLLLIVALPGQAQSPVWLVEKGDNRMYVAGTMHILTQADYPLPEAFETAYREAERLVFETDINKMEDPEFQQYLLREVSYRDGRNLQQVVRPDTYRSVEAFFTQRGVPMATVINFKPGMVATLMTIVELQRLGINGIGVDAWFNQRAQADGVATGQLETVEKQVAYIANMGIGQEDEMLSYNLVDIERLPEIWKAMTKAWRTGDLDWLDKMLAQPMRSDFPAVYEALLVERNNNWMPQLEAMAATPQIELILVGALHLSGADGLLAQLGARGYRVSQLP